MRIPGRIQSLVCRLAQPLECGHLRPLSRLAPPRLPLLQTRPWRGTPNTKAAPGVRTPKAPPGLTLKLLLAAGLLALAAVAWPAACNGPAPPQAGSAPAFQPEAVKSLGEPAAVAAVAVSPDGQLLVALTWQEARLWRVGDRSLLRTFAAEGVRYGSSQALAFSPDGKTLAIGARLWDIASGAALGAPVGRCELPPYVSDIRSVAFSPDGKHLALAGGTLYHYQVLLFNASTGALERTLQGWDEAVSFTHAVAFSPDGRRLAAATSTGGGKVRIWNLESGQVESTLKGFSNRHYVTQVAFLPDGKALAIADPEDWEGQERRSPGSVKLLDARTGEPVRSLAAGGEAVHAARLSFSVSPDGKLMATTDGIARVWDAQSGMQLGAIPQTLGISQLPEVTAVAFMPDSRTVACGYRDGTVWLWRVR